MLRVEYIDNHTAHRDLLFHLEGVTGIQYFDTYYFRLTDYSSIQDEIAALLDRWVKEVEGLTFGGITYLPIDYSDQYIGYIKVQSVNDSLCLCYGYARIDIDYIEPIGSPQFFEHGYRTDSPVINIAVTDFCKAIKQQADNLRSNQ